MSFLLKIPFKHHSGGFGEAVAKEDVSEAKVFDLREIAPPNLLRVAKEETENERNSRGGFNQ